MSARKNLHTSPKVRQEIQAPDDAVTQLASLGDAAKLKVQLDYRPVSPGTFSIAGVGVRDYSDGWLYDGDGERCGSIDYDKGEVLINVGTLRKKRDWVMRYEYDPAKALAAVDFEIVVEDLPDQGRRKP